MTEADANLLAKCWEKSGGRAWEPRDPKSPFFDRMIEAGYLRREDGRCGFEAFKDSHITWTEAGRDKFAA